VLKRALHTFSALSLVPAILALICPRLALEDPNFRNEKELQIIRDFKISSAKMLSRPDRLVRSTPTVVVTGNIDSGSDLPVFCALPNITTDGDLQCVNKKSCCASIQPAGRI
jgi:hypothetical protein